MKDSCSMLSECLERFFDNIKESPFDKAIMDLKMSFANNINLIVMNSKNSGNSDYVLHENIKGFKAMLVDRCKYLKDDCQRFRLLKALESVVDKYMMSKDITTKEPISVLGETIFTMLQDIKPCKQ